MLISELMHELELCQEHFKGEDLPILISYKWENWDREYKEDYNIDLISSHNIEIHIK